jgi:hypothetical protein
MVVRAVVLFKQRSPETVRGLLLQDPEVLMGVWCILRVEALPR